MKKINVNYHSSDLGNVCPKRTSYRAFFGNKIRIFNDKMYIYTK